MRRTQTGRENSDRHTHACAWRPTCFRTDLAAENMISNTMPSNRASIRVACCGIFPRISRFRRKVHQYEAKHKTLTLVSSAGLPWRSTCQCHRGTRDNVASRQFPPVSDNGPGQYDCLWFSTVTCRIVGWTR